MTVKSIQHSTAPFFFQMQGGIAVVSSKGRDDRSAFEGRDTPWTGLASFIVQLNGSDKPSPEGVANLNLFRAAPALLQVAIAFVHEHAKRGGVYDQILPIDEQDSMVRAAMRAVEEALSGELP